VQPHEIAKVKRALQYIKIAQRTDWVAFSAMIRGESFNEEFMKPLEKITGWDENDEKNVLKLAEKFGEESQGKSLKEKTVILRKIIAISGGTATAISLIGFIIWLARKRKKNAGK
jgi:hypothetical protein